MEPILQYLIGPAALTLLAGMGWLIKSIFHLFGENQKQAREAQNQATTAFIEYLRKRDEENTKERTERESKYEHERALWISSIDYNNNTTAEIGEAMKRLLKAMDAMTAAAHAENATLREISQVIKEIRDLDKKIMGSQ